MGVALTVDVADVAGVKLGMLPELETGVAGGGSGESIGG